MNKELSQTLKKHPTPWKLGFLDGSGINDAPYITDANDESVVSGGRDDWNVRRGANDPAVAALIVASVNALSLRK